MDLPTPLVPAHLPAYHPLVTRDYCLFTPAIAEMAEALGQWLDDKVEGAVIHGPSRFGKSSAVHNWVQTLLSERMGGYVPLVIWSHTSSGSQAGSFYSNLLHASRHPMAKAQRRPHQRHHMLIERWAELSAQGGGRFLVLLIDEAQGMTQREWLWLVQLHSDLQKERIQLCVFSIASLQFFDQATNMALAGGAHVAARFMLESRPFNGVRSVQELTMVLSGYDEGTEWPPGSRTSFTKGIVPMAWAAGFRMAEHADEVFKALVQELPPRYAGPTNFPMKTITQVARRVLLRIAGGAHWSDVTSPRALGDIVAASGHRALMAIVSAASPHRLGS